MKSLISIFFTLLVVLTLPGSANAEMPAPVLYAYESVYSSNKPFKAKLTVNSLADFFGLQMGMIIKGSNYRDTKGNSEGLIDIVTSLSDSTSKDALQKVSITMQYKLFPDDNKFYFNFNRLPKNVSPALKGVRTKVWYSADNITEKDIAALNGGGPFSGENFLIANTKYPALVYREKGSNRKEYVYTHSINQLMLSDFFKEHARLERQVLTPAELELLTNTSLARTGTLVIDRKTGLPKSETNSVDSKFVKASGVATYTFGGSTSVKPPKAAIPGGAYAELFTSN